MQVVEPGPKPAALAHLGHRRLVERAPGIREVEGIEPQAMALDELLRRLGQPLDRVVNLEVGGEEIVKRLLARGRSDDTEETIRERLGVYAAPHKPLLEYYR